MLIQFVLVFALLVALLVTWRRARQGVISGREAIFWSVLWIVAGVVILAPQTTTSIAHFFGVGRGVDFVLYASVLALFFLVFKIFLAIDRLERKLTDVVQRDALDHLEADDV
jgi:small membrane protein